MGHVRTAVATCVAAIAFLGAGTAHAAFPGTNGQIVYTTGGFSNSTVHTIFPDGTGDRFLLTGRGPAWSPQGDRIAYWFIGPEVFVARADGSNPKFVANGGEPAWSPDGTKLVHTGSSGLAVTDVYTGVTTDTGVAGAEPAWSPDGTKIAFSRDLFSGATDGDVWVMNADGSNPVNITDTGSGALDDSAPNWSPDGSRIVFVRGLQGTTDEIWTMNPDGSGAAQLTSNSIADGSPAWSPDGTKIAFGSVGEQSLFVMNADGSAPSPVTAAGVSAGAPDWQPVVNFGYPRPKSASPLRVSLVPAYNFCFASNRTHGPPLAFPSCAPPTQRSLTLTVGTPDANGAAPHATGFARLETLVGNPGTPADEADVKIDANVTDVRCTTANGACPDGALSDFSGQVLLTAVVRITDRVTNGPLTAGTMQNSAIRAPITCTSTLDPDIGSTCAVATTMDSLVPGAVPEGKRSIWAAGDVEVYDPGPNGTGYANCPPTCGNGDEALFMRQGVFVP